MTDTTGVGVATCERYAYAIDRQIRQSAHLFPCSAHLTAKLILWDAGTEVNKEPGIAPNQAPRQKAPYTGKDENSVIKNIKDIKDGFIYPKTASVMKVTITAAKSAAATNQVTVAESKKTAGVMRVTDQGRKLITRNQKLQRKEEYKKWLGLEHLKRTRHEDCSAGSIGWHGGRGGESPT